MGVDTKMFIVTKKENILEVMPKVIEGLNKFIRFELKAYSEKKGFDSIRAFIFRDKENEHNKNLKDFTNGIRNVYSYDFRSFFIDFTLYGEVRSLFITHSCSNDYSDIHKGDKIIFNLGAWGRSEEIMMVIAESIKDMGDIYFTKNDCAIDFKCIYKHGEEKEDTEQMDKA